MDQPEIQFETAYLAGNLAEADLVRGLLEANGVQAHIADESATAALDGIISGNRGVSVMVPATLLADARAIIEEARDLGGVILESEEDDAEE